MKNKKIELQFITASENIAWLLNIRGHDSDFSPIPNSYLVVDNDRKINLFCDLRKINNRFKKKFSNIIIADIKNVSVFLSKIKKKKF
mgnify:CR=1 FL=1